MKRISILGSTGSIGTQTVDILAGIGARAEALTTHRNWKLLERQARALRPRLAVAYEEEAAKALKTALADTDITVSAGMDGLIEAATLPAAQTVVTAVVGMVGLLPTLAAIDAGKDIALANKETLVRAGALVMERAREKKVAVLPVDSEHSAIFQCLQGAAGNVPERLILTASGGPFFGLSEEKLKQVTREQALRHPNWSMGAKITTDSATMMNKGLELIEAMWLFGVTPDQIEVVVHRESIVHSAVAFVDGAVVAQLGTPDMRVPIQYALTYPARLPCKAPRLRLAEVGEMHFDAPTGWAKDALDLARRAAGQKGNAGAVLNGANEAAVSLFLEDRLAFWEIVPTVRQALDAVAYDPATTLESALAGDRAAREWVLGR